MSEKKEKITTKVKVELGRQLPKPSPAPKVVAIKVDYNNSKK